MTGLAWMPVYVGDLLKEAMALDHADGYAVMLIRAHIWQNGPIPDDPKQLAKITMMEPRRWLRRYKNIKPLFAIVDGFWTDHDLMSKREKAQQRRDIAVENGKKGGRPKASPVGYENKTQRVSSSASAKHIPLPRVGRSSKGGSEIW